MPAAAKALRAGKSLLPAGVTRVDGKFERGDAVLVRDAAGVELARGLSAYSSEDARRARGRRRRFAEQPVNEFLDHSNRFNMRQPRSWAMAWSRASGLVATGSCTFSSSGMSFMESL